MSVLDVIDPPDCDEQGVPLDWERCRYCEGKPGSRAMCEICGGYGSLKAAALAMLQGERTVTGPHRCEDCGHPMSEGTWECDGAPAVSDVALHDALVALRAGREPLDLHGVHYSPCDEGCRHGGRARLYADLLDGTRGWVSVANQPPADALALPQIYKCEASWRPVDVRTLGWAHDLRPEKLAVLCLRCYVERKK